MADVPLTALAVEVLDASANLQVMAALAEGATTLASMGTLALNYSVRATDPSVLGGTFRLRITSVEAPAVIVPITFNVVPLVSRLVATPGSLNKSMLVGDQTSVEFTVTNTGGLATGTLNVLLPTGADWLSLATPATLPSLAPGASTSITLLLTPAETLALTAYNGSLIVRGDATQVSVPFSFRAVSDETGDLEITVVDEFFYFTEEKPLVTDATVILRDAITGQQIASSASALPPAPAGGPVALAASVPPTVTIDANGRVKFSGVPEGPYTLEVRADKHETYSNTIRVDAGELGTQQVFISRNLVEYTWTVEEVEIEDRTRIVIEAVFETNVPAPVVTVEGQLDLHDLQIIGQSQQFDIKITNHGLIAAFDVALDFGTHPFYEITPLIQNIGVLPAKSEIIVPVIVTRTGDFDTPEEAALAVRGSGIEVLAMLSAPTALETTITPQALTLVPCGIPASVIYAYICEDKVLKRVPIAVGGVEGNCPPFVFNPTPSPGGGGGGFPPGGPGGVSSPSLVTIVNCNECIEKLAEAAIKCVIKFIPFDDWEKCALGTYNCYDSSTGGFTTYETAKCAKTAWTCIKAIAKTAGKNIPGPPGWLKYLECAYEILTACLELNGGTGSASLAGRALSPMAAASTNLRSALGERFEKLTTYVSYLETQLDALAYTFGNSKFLEADTYAQLADWMTIIETVTTDDGDTSTRISASGGQVLKTNPARPTLLSNDEIDTFVDRWNRSLDYYDQGIFNLADLANGQNQDFIAVDEHQKLVEETIANGVLLEGDGFANVGEAIESVRVGILSDLAAYSGDGVCAEVRIQIEQQAVQTRTAFEATLGISNQTAESLQNIEVDVVVLDSGGQDVTDLFGVQFVSQNNFGNVGGTGMLASNAEGSAKWLIIPSSEAAPFGPTEYFVAGSFRYDEAGITVERTLLPTSIIVHPQAELDLDYFLQRDVISDDPHTAPIESAQPFTLAVLVQNNGAGAARNLRIESAQPKIIENEKGLLIDFEITGTKVNGGEVQRSLTANFGNVNPGAIAIGEWQMESTLQGLFTEYNATFEHVSVFGDNRLSLIKSVEIHELIHVTNASQVDGGDGLPDFLVNDLTDPDDLPDTLYLSDGSVTNVGLGTNAVVDASPVLGDFRVAVTASMTAGWSYLKMDDPSLGDLTLIGVQRSDGTAVPKENFWQTDRTFIGLGQRPVLEDNIHLLDYNSTGSYTFIFSNGDLTGPEVVSFAGVVPNPTTQTIDVIDVTFTERLNDASFGAADLSLTKNGGAVALLGLTITHVSGSTYRVSGLAPFTAQDAVYELKVNATGVTDQVDNTGVGMKSYRWVKGETAPTILSLTGAPSGLVTAGPASMDIVFSKPITGLDTTDLILTRGGSANLIDAQVTISQVGTSTYRIGNLARLTGAEGPYLFTVSAAGVQDGVGNAGLGTTTAEWTLDSTAPQLLDVNDPATNPRNIVVQQLDVEFSEPIDLSSLDVGDLKLVRNGSATNLIAGDSRVTFESRGANVYRIGGINWVQAFTGTPQVADFTLTVDATGATDLAGNAGVGLLSSTWTLDLDQPAVATGLVVSTFSGSVNDGKVNARQATVAGTLSEAGLTVVIRDMTTDTDLIRQTIAGTTFSLPIEFPSAGQHRLRVRTIDPAGNTADTFIENLFVSETPPVVDMLTGLPGERTRNPLNFIDLKFLAPIDATTLTKAALSISRNGGANLVDGTVSIVAQPDGKTYRFTGLAPITGDEGRYDFRLDLAGVRNSAGLVSGEIRTSMWINDHTAPTSTIRSLEFSQELNSFIIDLVGNEPVLPGGIAPSGLAAFDLYYSDNGSPFQLLETLPADTPTTTFVGEPNHIYYFRSVARDTAGNIESKANRVDAWTYVPDLIAPETNVGDVDTTDATFEVTFTGADRGMGLRTIELFVQVDGGAVQSVGVFNAGDADESGNYAGAASYQANADGSFHEYRFFTTGTDWEGNIEERVDAPADIVVIARFTPPTQTKVVDFDVQDGANQRSFIRYLDVFFNTASQLNDIVNSLSDAASVNDRIRLTRYGLDGGGPGSQVNLAGRVSAIDQALALDFGADGLGGDRTGASGDGYYKLALDLDGDGSLETELAFFRLLGDVDGDGDADNMDLASLNAALGQIGANLDGDINGDGRVNSLDRQAWQRGRGKMLAAGLPLAD